MALGEGALGEYALGELPAAPAGNPWYYFAQLQEDREMQVIVDTAVIVPVNALPLIDDTDFKSIEAAVAYNASGMDLRWNFVTPAGVQTSTAVTPTTGGVYDWTHMGDGIYSMEIPASGGASANNDTEGYGWFSGVVTGVLPFRGPIIQFSPAQIVNSMVIGSDKLQVDAVEISSDSAAADNLEAYTDGTTPMPVNTTQFAGTNITAASGIPEVRVASIANNAITAAAADPDFSAEVNAAVLAILGTPDGASIAADILTMIDSTVPAIQQLRDQLIVAFGLIAPGSTTTDLVIGDIATDDAYNGYLVKAVDFSTGISYLRWITDYVGSTFTATLDTALPFTPDETEDTYVIYPFRLDAPVINLIKAVTDKLDDTIETTSDGNIFTADALQNAPSGAGPSAADIADAVWEEAIADHSGTSGSTAEALSAAGASGDPWITALPGAYSAGQAGYILGTNLNATVSSRATQTSVDTVDGIVDAIKASTDNLPSDPADASVVAGLIAAVEAKVDTVDTVVDAVKAKTDNLPASPAATGDIPTAVQNADALLGRNVSGGSSSGRTVKQAFHFIRNKWVVAAGTLTVYDTDDSTPSWTGAVTGTPGADPVTGMDAT